MISRRKFFGFAAAGSLLLPELLSTTSIFLPPVGGWPSRVERFPIFSLARSDGTPFVGPLFQTEGDKRGELIGGHDHVADVPFIASPEHLRRKVRLDLVDDQLVWVPA